MTDLTEKWQKGELSDRWYYVKNESGDIHPSEYMKECVGINGCVVFGFLNEVPEITEVIDKVPSFEEWKASEKYNKHLEEVIKIYERKEKQHTDDAIAYNELLEEYTKLKEELKDYEYQHKQDGICYDDIFCKLELARKENRQLRELLKECKFYIGYDTYEFDEKVNKLLTKINQALGEE